MVTSTNYEAPRYEIIYNPINYSLLGPNNLITPSSNIINHKSIYSNDITFYRY